MTQRNAYYPRHFTVVFLALYGLSALYIFHKMLINYSNSSYIERLTSPEAIGILYALGSAGAIATLLVSPTLFRLVDRRWLAFTIATTEIVALILVGLNLTPVVTLGAFVVALVLMPSVGLVIDLLAEAVMGDDESATGTRWALMLSAMSIVSIIATLTLSGVVGSEPERLQLMYFISAATLIVLLITVQLLFRNHRLPEHPPIRLRESLVHLWQDRDLRFAYLARLTLSIFFGTVAIYLPLYLVQEFGFSWGAIGLLLAAEFTAYLVSEYPIGVLADRYWGEVEMLIAGFLLLTGVMGSVSFLSMPDFWVWAALFFTMGLGGSLVETTLVSYYYKHTTATDVDLISFFRTTTPFAAGIGALLGSAVLWYLSFPFIFLCLAGLLLVGVVYATQLRDTR